MGTAMTLEEAREILGDEAEGYTDETLLELMYDFERIARLAVRNYRVLKKGKLDSLDLVI